MLKKVSKKAFIICAIVLLGGLGGIIADRYLFPYLSSTKIFSKYEFLKKSTEDVTVINKTEQVFIKEETSISKISNQVASSVVNIISIPKAGLNAKATPTKQALSIMRNRTGVIVTSDGMIMTYTPGIVSEKTQYKVMTYDGNIHDAELIGVDSYSNLEFLKINASNLPAVSFGNSDDSQPGEKIIAVGNNFGSYANSYAAGLLSDFDPTFNLSGKTVSSSEKLEGVFGTDFNSAGNLVGGPVVDYMGQVVGIIGSIERDGKNIDFLIPSNKVKKVMDRAIKKELSMNPELGIYYLPITRTYALMNSLGVERGALIFSPSGQQGLAVIASLPAQKAGLQINDIITKINGQEISANNTLSDILYQSRKGNQIELSIMRDGQEIKIAVQL